MKIGRNEKCPCGSGKKYKNCHLNHSIKPLSLTPAEQAYKYKQHLAIKFKTLLALNKELRNVVEKLFSKELEIKTSKSFFAGFVLGKAYKTHGVILNICEDGYGEDAAVLVRTVFDLLITFLYINKDKTNYRISRYLSHDWILRQKTYEYAKNKPAFAEEIRKRALKTLPTQNTPEEIKKYAREAQTKYKYKNVGWSDKSIRDMSEEVGRLDAYSTVYRLQSQITHGATRVMNDYVKAAPKGFTIEIGPSENWISESLVTAFDFLYSIAGEYDKMHELGFAKNIDAVAEKWVNQVDEINKKTEITSQS